MINIEEVVAKCRGNEANDYVEFISVAGTIIELRIWWNASYTDKIEEGYYLGRLEDAEQSICGCCGTVLNKGIIGKRYGYSNYKDQVEYIIKEMEQDIQKLKDRYETTDPKI